MPTIEMEVSFDLDNYRDDVIEYINDHVAFCDLGSDTKEEAEEYVLADKDPDDFFDESTLLDWVFENVDHDVILDRLEAEVKPKQ